MPGLKQPCPIGRRLLVAGHAENADGRAEQFRRGFAELAGAIAHLRQQALRHAEQAAQARRPTARCRYRTAACARHWWRRSRAPCRRSAATAGSSRWCRRRARPASADARAPSTLSSSQAILLAEKYGSSSSPVLAAIVGSWPARRKRIAEIRGAAVLPDDGVVDRLAGGAVPEHRGLALIGDADAGDVSGGKPRLRHRRRARSRPTACQISSGSCSTRPGAGKICRSSCCAVASGRSAASNAIARVEVVP